MAGLFDDLIPASSSAPDMGGGEPLRITVHPRPAVPPPQPPNAGTGFSDLTPKAPAPTTTPQQRQLIDFENVLPAATQGTSPNTDQYKGKLISSDAYQNDAGEIQYKDPVSGKIVTTDSKAQVAIRDPADNTIKIYQRSDATNESPATGVARVLAPGLMTGAPTRLPGGAGAVASAVKAAEPPSIGQIKQAASAAYNSTPVTSLEVKPQTLRNFGDTIRATLNEAGFDENVAPKTFGILNNVAKVPEEAIVTGRNLHSIRKVLGKATQAADPTEKQAAREAMRAFDQFVENIPAQGIIKGDPAAASAAFKEGNANWSAASRAANIDKKLTQAELRAAAANSGTNVANTIRQRMADVLINPKLRQGYSPEELAQMEQIVRGTFTRNAMRFTGNMLGGGGGLGAVAVGTAGGLATGGPGAALPLVGVGLRKLSEALTLRDVGELSKLIRSNTPLAKQLAPPMRNWANASAAFLSRPTPRTIAAVSLAARNLANNLSDAGISISPQHLLQSLQSPGTSEAQPPANQAPPPVDVQGLTAPIITAPEPAPSEPARKKRFSIRPSGD